MMAGMVRTLLNCSWPSIFGAPGVPDTSNPPVTGAGRIAQVAESEAIDGFHLQGAEIEPCFETAISAGIDEVIAFQVHIIALAGERDIRFIIVLLWIAHQNFQIAQRVFVHTGIVDGEITHEGHILCEIMQGYFSIQLSICDGSIRFNEAEQGADPELRKIHIERLAWLIFQRGDLQALSILIQVEIFSNDIIGIDDDLVVCRDIPFFLIQQQ